MAKEELLKFCRYYHGEENCKCSDPEVQTLCKIEKMWVDSMSAEDSDFDALLDDYITNDLTSFCETDNVPVTLKALLFNRFTQYNDRIDVDAFKIWYKQHYD